LKSDYRATRRAAGRRRGLREKFPALVSWSTKRAFPALSVRTQVVLSSVPELHRVAAAGLPRACALRQSAVRGEPVAVLLAWSRDHV